jgi:serine/threonine protein kinase
MKGSTSTQEPSSGMALFDLEEVIYGRLLGTGAFCDVHEIEAFHTTSNNRFSAFERNKRDLLVKQNAKNTDAPFVIKTIRPQINILTRDFQAAAGDLDLEASILGKIEHRNIIKLHGRSTHGVNDDFSEGGNDAHFLILERLEGTLEDRMTDWKRQMYPLRTSELSGLFQSKQTKIQTKIQIHQLFVERLEVALEIASALNYLHGERIVYRDLKPANVGIDATNVCKLFDFGLARPLPEETYASGYSKCLEGWVRKIHGT